MRRTLLFRMADSLSLSQRRYTDDKEALGSIYAYQNGARGSARDTECGGARVSAAVATS